MLSPRLLWVLLSLLTALVAAASCSTSGGSGAPSASASSSATSSSSGAGGVCSSVAEAFGACDGDLAPDGGAGAPGSACSSDSDCAFACCPCPEGQDQYAYAACSCGRCTSVCNPANDYRAPACADAGPVTTGCWRCSQVLNEALAEGSQLGLLSCAGPAATDWTALSGCANAACGGACDGGVMPNSACVACIETSDDAGGCATEIAACQSH